MRKLHLLPALLLAFSCIFTACSDSKDDPEPNPDPHPVPGALLYIDGYAELGAFRHESEVTFYPLDKTLERSKDRAFSDEVTSELGLYTIKDRMILQEVFFEVEVTGNFFNGIKNDYSKSPVTMHAINHVGTPFTIERMTSQIYQLPPTNINILTQLTTARVRTLIKEKMKGATEESSLKAFQEASKQAMEELMTVFAIRNYDAEMPSNTSFWNAGKDSGLMAAISAIILEGVSEDFLNTFFTEWDKDFAQDGRIDNDVILESIHSGQQDLESTKVRENLQTFYAAHKKNFSFPPFWQFIDRNGDGVIDDNDKPEGSEIKPEEFTPSEQQCRDILKQLYKRLREYMQIESVWEANFCGAIEPIPGYPTTLIPSDREVYEIWVNAYGAIQQCNILIYSLTNKKYDYNVEPYIGTAYTIQSQIYLSLTQLFGDVPHVTPENFSDVDAKIVRTPVKEIYTQQIDLLMTYGANLPQAIEPNELFTNTSTIRLLGATMYMELGDYENAEKFLDSCETYYLNPYVWKVDNSELPGENRPLYSKYIGGDYHIIYHSNICHLLKAENYLATNKVAKAVDALKNIDESMQVADNNIKTVKACLIEYAKKYMGKSFGYFALLKRMGVAKEMLQIEDYQLLLPIPLQEMDSNPNMEQNPGYK